MNKERWRKCKSASRLVAKLAEETGEVAAAYGDVLDSPNDDLRAASMHHLRYEIGHVRFIAGLLDKLIEDSPYGGPIGALEETNAA